MTDLAAALKAEREAWSVYTKTSIVYQTGGALEDFADASILLTHARMTTDAAVQGVAESVVYLNTGDVRDLCKVLLDASRRGSTVRLWVDDGGLKHSIDRHVWSYPPLGTTTNPLDF